MSDKGTTEDGAKLRLVTPGVDFSKAEGGAAGNRVVHSNAADPEDEFRRFYATGADNVLILEPPYVPTVLDRLSQENNALSPCVEAMVTNIDGTGYDFELEGEKAEDDEDDTEILWLKEFFAEPWPDQSFVTIRKQLRRDLERTGNAYIEVLTDATDSVVFFRRVDAKMMRLVSLDDPVPVRQKIKRRGKEIEVTLMKRERRFAQLVNGTTLAYFAEAGASRDLDKTTGKWAPRGQRLPVAKRATQVIHFTLLPDAHTPYGVPRWIGQLPSILGSRKAEEFNLDFFDHGGVPPVLIILQGGTLQPQTTNAIETKLGRGSAAKKNRVQVIETMPSGGTFNSPNNTRVTVERFGSERQDDSMFENYDEKCEIRVRRSFRLPPIFIGAADDYNFASAVASYAVAEAQVFKPERDEFDEIVTNKLVRVLAKPGYRLMSKPLVIEDATNKLQGIQLAKDLPGVQPKDVLYEINEATGTDLRYDEALAAQKEEADKAKADADATLRREEMALRYQAGPAAPVKEPEVPEPKGEPNGKGRTGTVLKMGPILAVESMAAMRTRDADGMSLLRSMVRKLGETDAQEFDDTLVTARFGREAVGVEGLAALSKATLDVIQKDHACACGEAHDHD